MTELIQATANAKRVRCITGWASLVLALLLYPRYDAKRVERQPAVAAPMEFPLMRQQKLIAYGAFIVMLLIYFNHCSRFSGLGPAQTKN